MERWLALTIFEHNTPKTDARRPLYFISIPKKVVRQAVRRNRIKRVLREAIRNAGFLTKDKQHRFKVLRSPEHIDLSIAQQALRELVSHD